MIKKSGVEILIMENSGQEIVDIHISKCSENAVVPQYARLGDAGMDIRASEDVLIRPQETLPIPTGLKFAIPVGYEIQVRPRSGLSLNTPLRVANSPGTIDSGFRGEVKVIMTNSSPSLDESSSESVLDLTTKGNVPGSYLIRQGDRIAQIVLQKVPAINWIEVESVDDIGQDRGGGFGSSGIG